MGLPRNLGVAAKYFFLLSVNFNLFILLHNSQNFCDARNPKILHHSGTECKLAMTLDGVKFFVEI